jgi:hypothetical protein
MTQKPSRHFDESRCGASFNGKQQATFDESRCNAEFNGKPQATEDKGVRSRLRLAVKRGSCS